MEAPGPAKAAAADPDPPESPGGTPDGAPAYRLQDFDTLATVGECHARGPGAQGRPGRRRQTKGPARRRPPPPGRTVPGPACSPRPPRRPESWGDPPKPPRASQPARASKSALWRPPAPKAPPCVGPPDVTQLPGGPLPLPGRDPQDPEGACSAHLAQRPLCPAGGASRVDLRSKRGLRDRCPVELGGVGGLWGGGGGTADG